MYGEAGNDTLIGEDDCDYPEPNPDDTMYGGPGDDRLCPWSDDANVYGGDGDEYLDGQCRGVMSFHGGDGNDTLTADDYYVGNYGAAEDPDYLNCGPGDADEVTYDKGIDRVRNCEIRHPRVGQL